MLFPLYPQLPGHPGRVPKATKPVFLASPKCPACGRERAIVFQVVRRVRGRLPETHPVCLGCYPTGAGTC
jgi:hypothetical protein